MLPQEENSSEHIDSDRKATNRYLTKTVDDKKNLIETIEKKESYDMKPPVS
jgi:hypothetical protein